MKVIYRERYPLFIKKYIDPSIEKDKEKLDINELYSELTGMIIDQDEAIKEILSVLWKQCNFPTNKSRSLLVKGNTAVGKTEIFRYLLPKLNIPYFMATVDYMNSQYNNKCIEGMLFELLKSAEYDEEKASRGILIIDKVEKIGEVSYQSNIINDLLKIFDGDTFKLYLNIGEYTINTKNLMVICLFNPRELETTQKHVIGYARNDKEVSKEREELLSKFSKVVQMN